MKQELDLILLKTFVAVADEAQFVAAAARLGTSQGLLSQRIKRIEDILGVPIMERSRNGLKLTDTGEILYEEANAILKRTRLGIRRVCEHVQGKTGELQVGLAPWLLYGFTPTMLNKINLSIPNLKITIHCRGSSEQVKKISSGDYDAGIIFQPIDTKNLISIPLFKVPSAIVMRSDDPLARKRKVQWKHLKDRKIMLARHQSDKKFLAAINKRCADTGFAPQLIPTRHILRSAMAIVAMGEGLVLAPAVPAIKSFGLKILPIMHPPEMKVALVHRKDDERSSLIQFVTKLKESKQDLQHHAIGVDDIYN